jgi:hypothetical protein
MYCKVSSTDRMPTTGLFRKSKMVVSSLSKRGKWVQLGELINDDILNACAVVAPLDQTATEVRNRFEGLIDRFSFYAPYKVDPEMWEGVLAGFH